MCVWSGHRGYRKFFSRAVLETHPKQHYSVFHAKACSVYIKHLTCVPEYVMSVTIIIIHYNIVLEVVYRPQLDKKYSCREHKIYLL